MEINASYNTSGLSPPLNRQAKASHIQENAPVTRPRASAAANNAGLPSAAGAQVQAKEQLQNSVRGSENAQKTLYSEKLSRDETQITELKPVVIDQTPSPETRAFIEVAKERSEFRLIDIYV